ncbi:hypothetical protein BDW02DRAFT_112765 [Decorospora gaudefroyi]|uniref:Uncharacterized protein n=1 Tax=Decorospora gaudefroyi TaxID=184978 RepID=A0A6A5K2B1_9PLEO|nr:hypothetical protein BDW02DRAFT_112765 [Decorospora gaudefroyi]
MQSYPGSRILLTKNNATIPHGAPPTIFRPISSSLRLRLGRHIILQCIHDVRPQGQLRPAYNIVADPKTLDPIHFSVLSVLKTAIPTGPNPPMPTGDVLPAWYIDLPKDVKSLLPCLYPAATTTSPEGSSTPAVQS